MLQAIQSPGLHVMIQSPTRQLKSVFLCDTVTTGINNRLVILFEAENSKHGGTISP